MNAREIAEAVEKYPNWKHRAARLVEMALTGQPEKNMKTMFNAVCKNVVDIRGIRINKRTKKIQARKVTK